MAGGKPNFPLLAHLILAIGVGATALAACEAVSPTSNATHSSRIAAGLSRTLLGGPSARVTRGSSPVGTTGPWRGERVCTWPCRSPPLRRYPGWCRTTPSRPVRTEISRCLFNCLAKDASVLEKCEWILSRKIGGSKDMTHESLAQDPPFNGSFPYQSLGRRVPARWVNSPLPFGLG